MCKELFLEKFKMGLFNDVGDQNIHGQLGPPGPPGPGFNKTSDGNYDAEDKKLCVEVC